MIEIPIIIAVVIVSSFISIAGVIAITSGMRKANVQSSNVRSRAEEDLRVIRTLMERATVYRAISAPTALVGGIVSLLSAFVVYLSNQPESPFGHAIERQEFALLWIGVLLLTMLVNAFFVWREAKSSVRPFFSSGMMLALRAITPNLIVPALFTVWFIEKGYLGAVELELVVIWVVFYGLALLSTSLFAPSSLALLGWAFLLSGSAILVIANWVGGLSGEAPNVIMGLTFGLYHVIYAACTWSRKRDTVGEQPVVE